jgi:protein involved in polysaccharide export with SLBB domain
MIPALPRLGLAAVLALVTAAVAAAQDGEAPGLAKGDVLRLRVYQHPDLSDAYVLGDGGELVVPGLGRVARITDLEMARAAVSDLIDRNLGLTGTSFSLQVEARRPVTVGGNVREPGEVPYTDGLMVLQAVAKAGGLGTRQSVDEVGRLIQVNQERERLAQSEIRLATAYLERQRLEAELRGEPMPPPSEQVIRLVGEETAERLRGIEADIMQTRSENFEIALGRIESAADINRSSIAARETTRDSLEEQYELIRADLERLEPLIQRGAITGDRILALRRDFAQVEGLLGEAETSVAQARTEEAILREERRAQELERRLGLLSELISAEEEIVSAATSVDAVRETLEAAGEAPLSVSGRREADDCRITLVRRDAGGDSRMRPVTALATLRPGDHIEVGRWTRDCPSLLSGDIVSQ